MLSYNHEKYIRDALNSILNQKTNFGFEILVHDDASIDGSQEIIKDYASRYPRIVKPILQSVNQYSQKIYPSVHFNYPRANLPFMAICEGDDFWTNENKLKVQIDGLRNNPAINLSFHSAIFSDHQNEETPERIFGDYRTDDSIIPFSDIMLRPRGWIPTASCIVRKSAKDQFLNFLRSNNSYLTVGDIYLQFFGGLPNGALYYAKPMAFYRYSTAQSWTRKTHNNPEFKATHEVAMIRSYLELNRITQDAYRSNFKILELQRLLWLFDGKSSTETNPVAARLEPLYATCESHIEKTLQEIAGLQKNCVIFGCASGCQRILNALPSEQTLAIVDRDNLRSGENIRGKPVIGPKDLGRYRDCALIVSTIGSDREAISQLAQDSGIPETDVYYLFDEALAFLEKQTIIQEIFNE